MKYSFTVKHVPGKMNYIAHFLSRQPADTPSQEDIKLADNVEIGLVADVRHLTAIESRLQKLRHKQAQDTVIQSVIEYAQRGWPSYLSEIDTGLKPYWRTQSELTLTNGLLLNTIAIPPPQRHDILGNPHNGQLDIRKCRGRT